MNKTNLPSKSLILTGCAGFIGINFLKQFVGTELYYSYNKIITIDKIGYAAQYNKKEYFDITDSNSKFEVYNYSTEQFVKEYRKKMVKRLETYDILDFASSSHVDNSITSPVELFRENAMIPANIIEAIGIENIDTYYHISTDEVYGDIDLQYKHNPEFGSFKTHSPYKPSNPYSASKVAQDAYLESMSRTFGMKVCLIRMANQYGPYQHKEKMIPFSIYRVLNNESIKVYGNGTNCRQWTYVEDTVKVIYDIIDYTKIVNPLVDETKLFQIIHIADTNNLFDNNYVAESIGSLVCKYKFPTKLLLSPKDLIEYIKDRPGHDMMYCLDVVPLVQKYFKTSFTHGMEKTVQYYLSLFGDNNANSM